MNIIGFITKHLKKEKDKFELSRPIEVCNIRIKRMVDTKKGNRIWGRTLRYIAETDSGITFCSLFLYLTIEITLTE
jgi:hypothetical protein